MQLQTAKFCVTFAKTQKSLIDSVISFQAGSIDVKQGSVNTSLSASPISAN